MSQRRQMLALASVATLVAATARAQGKAALDVAAFSSVQDLLLQSPSTTPRLAIVAGYSAAGDGGGGLFVWSPSDTARPDQGLIFSSQKAANEGRWRRAHEGPIDVRMFGARGDGKTDDTAAIQAAIDAASGAEVRIPAGTWLITRTLRFISPAGRHSAGLKLIGEGTYATIIDCRVKEGPALRIEQAEGYKFGVHGLIRDIEFNGMKAPGGREQHGIVISGAWMYRLDRLVVGWFRGTGLMAPMVDDRSGALSDVEIEAGSNVIHRAKGEFRTVVPGTGAGYHVVGDGIADGTLIEKLEDDWTIRLTKPALKSGRTSAHIWGGNTDGQQSIITAMDCRFQFNGGWGIFGDVGVGLELRLSRCHISVNSAGGIRATGFLDMEGGTCGGNGTDDTGVGILLEGPGKSSSELTRIESVEIDSNLGVNLWIKQARFVRVTRCRFNAHEIERLGKQIPPVAIRLGNNDGIRVFTIELSKNEIRVDAHYRWPHVGIEILDGANVDDIVVRDTLFWGGWSDAHHTRYRIGKLADPGASLRIEDYGAPVAGFPVRPVYVARMDTKGDAPLALYAGRASIVRFKSATSSLAKPATVWPIVELSDLSTKAGTKQATIETATSLSAGMPLLLQNAADVEGQSGTERTSYSRITAQTDARTLELDRIQDQPFKGRAFAGGLTCPYEGYFAIDIAIDVRGSQKPHPVDITLLVDGKPYRTETSVVHGLGTTETIRFSAMDRWPTKSAFHVALRSAAETSMYFGCMTVRLLT